MKWKKYPVRARSYNSCIHSDIPALKCHWTTANNFFFLVAENIRFAEQVIIFVLNSIGHNGQESALAVAVTNLFHTRTLKYLAQSC